MSWRDISMDDLTSFFIDWKNKKELQEKFSFTTSETRHCFDFLKKLNEFEFRETMGKRRRFHELKSKDNKNV